MIFNLHSPALDPVNLYIFSSLINTLFFVLFVTLRKKVPNIKECKQIFSYAFINSIFFGIAWIVLNYGLSLGQVSLVIPISSLSPAITVVLAVIFFKEKLVLNQKLGILTIMLGLFLISL